MIFNKRKQKTSMLAVTASVASLLAMGSVSVTWAATGTPSNQSPSSSSQLLSSGQNAPSTTQSVYGSTQTNSTNPAVFNSPTPPNPEHVAAAKQQLSSYLSSVQSLIASDPVLAQTDTAAKVQEQQQAVNNMSDTTLAAFYNYTQAQPGWQNWLKQEQTILQNVESLEQKAGIKAGGNTSTGTTSPPTTTSKSVLNSPLATVHALTASSISTTTTNITPTSSTSDSLTVTINQNINAANASQGAAQTVSDPTVINFTNVPSSPTPADAFSAQLAADLMGMGANIAQSFAGDAPSELIVVALGEGASVPDPARIVAEAIATGLYISQEALQETANGLNMTMTNNNNLQGNDLATLSTNMYNNILTILSNLGTVNDNLLTVNRNVKTVNSNVNVADQHVQTLSYRDIERDLADKVPLVSLYLPIKDGGYLEDVESFVQTLISESASANIDVTRAQDIFNEGKTDVTEGAYYDAYTDFAQAYDELQDQAKRVNDDHDRGPDHSPDHGPHNTK